MPLRFLVKTAITLVTPPVVFHNFPYPSHMCFSSRCYSGTRAESRWNHGCVTADMAIPLSYHCGLTAVRRRSLAAGQRCWRQNCGASEVPLQGWRCYCGGAATAGRLHDVRAAAIYGMWFSEVLRFRCC